jgi:hypothetical protein
MFTLPEEMVDKLQKYKIKTGIPMSRQVAEALDDYFTEPMVSPGVLPHVMENIDNEERYKADD